MRRPAPWARSHAVAGLLVTAAALAFAPTSLVAQRDDQRNAPEVRRLDLRGVHQVNPGDLARSIATSASRCKTILFQPFCWVSRSPTFWHREYLNKDEFKRDALRVLVFYWKRGYREATVDTAVTPMGDGHVKVTFDIVEGPPTVIGSLRVEYDSTLLDERRVRKLSLLRAGDPLNLVVLDTMRLGFMLDLWDKGYADAQVDTVIAVNAEQRRAAVLLRLQANWRTTVGQITVRGNDEVDVQTIQNSILLRPGRLFRYSELTESQRNLYESNLFRLAMLTVPPRLDSIKDVNIDVRETEMREARIAAGFNNIDFIQADGQFTHYNTFGGARRLDIIGSISNLGARGLNGRGIFREVPSDAFFEDDGQFQLPTWSASIDLKQPAWLRQPENALAMGVFAHRRAAPSVYIDKGYGAQASVTRNLAMRASASALYRFEITRVEASDVYYCVNYGVCDESTIGTLRRNRNLSPLLLSASIDRSDKPFSPTKGYIARVDLDHASGITGSDYRYNRGFAEASVYTHFRYPSRDPRSQVLAAHARLGIVRPLGTNVLHPRTRFYAGGSQSVRGYGPNELGPKILTISADTLARRDSLSCDTSTLETIRLCSPNLLYQNKDFTVRPVGGTALAEGSVEYRMPHGPKIEYAVFLDGAIVGGSAVGSLGDSLTLPRYAAALTPGVGLRYRSPVGPIRVDLGYNPKATETLPVLTSVRDSDGKQRLIPLAEPRRFTSGGTASGFWGLFNRLVLHLSIGQAY
jgi:outer membrane protein assembly factor BamA